MTRDLRLLPAACLGWLGCLAAVRGGFVLGCVLVLAGLGITGVGAARAARPPHGRHRRRTHGRAAATVVLTGTVLAMLSGWSLARAEVRQNAVEPYLGHTVVAQLRVTAEPRPIGEDVFLVSASWVTAEKEGDGRPLTVDVGVLLLTDSRWGEVVVGSVVRATVRVSATEPGDEAAALLVPDGEPLVVARAPPLAALVATLRAGLLAACAGLDAQARGLVPGIALGDDRALPQSLEDDLRTVSLTHVTAVSGAHVAMVLGLVLAALMWAPRLWRGVVAAAVLVALVLLVHPTASVLRSAAMGAVLLVGLLLARPRAALPALWVSVMVLLAADPWLAGSFGFVLSVLATAGLLIGSAPLAERLSRAVPRALANVLAVPIAAQLACLPALAMLQPGLPVHGVLANVLAAPAVPPATVLGLTATLVHPVLPGLGEGLASWAGVATAWIASVAIWCAALPLATVSWWVALPCLGAAALACLRGPAMLRRARGLVRNRLGSSARSR